MVAQQEGDAMLTMDEEAAFWEEGADQPNGPPAAARPEHTPPAESADAEAIDVEQYSEASALHQLPLPEIGFSTEAWRRREVLVTATCNVTACGGLRRLVSRWMRQAWRPHVLLVQEHHLDEDEAIDSMQQWLLGRGYISIFSKAARTSEGGTSGGVAVLATAAFGLRRDEGTEVPSDLQHRVLPVIVETSDAQAFAMAAVYLEAGGRVTATDVSILQCLDGFRRRARACAWPVLFGGDWNVEIDEAFVQMVRDHLGLQVLGPPTPTCFYKRGASLLDAFIGDQGLLEAAYGCAADVAAATRPHRPVIAAFRSSWARARVTTWERRPRLPRRPACGPPRRGPDWTAARRSAERAAHAASTATSTREVRDALDDAVSDWMRAATRVIVEASHADVKPEALASFARPPRLVRRQPEMPAPRPADDDEAAAAGAEEVASMLGAIRSAAEESVQAAAAVASAARWTCEARRWMQTAADHALPRPWRELLLDPRRPTAQQAAQATLLETLPAENLAQWQLQTADQRAASSARRWHEWAREAAIAPGAAKAHRWTKTPSGWARRPVQLAGLPGQDAEPRWTALPSGLIAAEERRLSQDLWRSRAAPEAAPMAAPQSRTTLPKLTRQELSAAICSFPVRTAAGYDALAPSHFRMIDGEGLDILADIFHAWEKTLVLPRALRPVKVALIPKRSGAWRGIGIFPALVRIYTKARSPLVKAWEATLVDPFLAQTTAAAPLDPIWRIAMQAEAATTDGDTAAAMALDISAFFESVDWGRLRARALAEGFPAQLLQMALQLYAAPRHVTGDGVVGQPRYPSRGITPGCPWAMALAKAYTVEPFRRAQRWFPQAQLTLFVDDVVVAAQGCPAAVANTLVDAGEALLQTIEVDLACSVALEKVVVVAAQPKIAREVCRRLELPQQVVTESAVFLGGEYAAGAPRRRWSSTAGRKRRAAAVGRRRSRLAAFRAAAGRAAQVLARTGIVPAASHACEIYGASDEELERFQRMAAQVMRPSAARRSLTALRLVRGDPAARAAFAPLLRWAKEVWLASTGAVRATPLPQLRRAWLRALPARCQAWSDVTGPLSAAVLSAKRIGWKFQGPFTMQLPSGQRVLLTATPPAMLERLALDAWTSATEQRLARKWLPDGDWGADDPRRPTDETETDVGPTPPAATAIRAVLRERALTPLEEGTLAAVATDAVWPRQRLADFGLAESAACTCCATGLPDTLHHRAWICPSTQDLRERLATPDQIRRAQARPASLLWSRGWLPSATALAPPPLDLKMWQWTPQGGTRRLERLDALAASWSHWIFVDGSATTNADRRRRRAGWAAVHVAPYLVNGALVKLGAIWGTPPASWVQTSQAGEFAAALAALEVATPDARIFSDCKAVIDLLKAPPRTGLRPQRLWAGAYRLAHATAARAALAQTLTKVPAHASAYEGEPPDVRLRRLANDWADELAKVAVQEQPKLPGAEAAALARLWRDAQTACRVLAAASARWPPAAPMVARPRRPTTRAGRAAQQAAAQAARAEQARQRREDRQREQHARQDSHAWVRIGEATRRCVRCLAWHSRDVAACPGYEGAAWRDWEAQAAASGHAVRRGLLFDEGDDAAPMLVCVACGAHTVTADAGYSQRSALLGQCREASRAGREMLSRVARGLHPKGRRPRWCALHRAAGEPDGRVQEARVAAGEAGQGPAGAPLPVGEGAGAAAEVQIEH